MPAGGLDQGVAGPPERLVGEVLGDRERLAGARAVAHDRAERVLLVVEAQLEPHRGEALAAGLPPSPNQNGKPVALSTGLTSVSGSALTPVAPRPPA